jgi:branched-chain amino acid transport system substrate-binding protein
VKIDEPLSRREFLELAGKAGLVAGMGAAFGSVLAACRDGEDTSNTIATVAPDVTTTTVPRPTTTVSTGPETGRYLRIGVVSPAAGPLALFGRADEWWMDRARAALPEGLVCGDGRLHRLNFVVRDSGSDPGIASQAGNALIAETQADVILCSGPASVVNPVATQAEALGCPCLSSFVLWRPYVFERGGTLETKFKWTYAFAIDLEDIAANYLAMWGQVETNKKVGFVFSDDAQGKAWADVDSGIPPAAAAAGYEAVSPGPYAAGSEDFTAHIAEFVKNGCEICCGAMSTSDFLAFWKQCLGGGYQPKVVTMGEALLFPQALEAAGPSACNTTAEALWNPDWPYRDSLAGDSAQELASDYMVKTGEQWVAPIAQYSCLEWALSAFKATKDVDDKQAFIEAVRTTSLTTCLGAIDFKAPVDGTDPSTSKRPVENVCKAPVGGAQWVLGSSFAFECNMVSNANSSALVTDGMVAPMAYEEA